ncbi:hypothetical protein BCR32DRAFT_278735 [Anaeromyces robustus]|uniref:Uncharacterized protein n=1 Tax=Anaeromyces robustus TaxID=1754192 RepID=A0A1Y1XAX6_9FUNG|nr:hypothetical protein BCR32DRAFT_278735 [Anaeromyces robustus]|eukprot:ORX82586.1 hypothetical protein BCR32DRAFT_278735 [Anaeromyces robustus]
MYYYTTLHPPVNDLAKKQGIKGKNYDKYKFWDSKHIIMLGEQSFEHWIFDCPFFSLIRWNSLDFINDLFITFADKIKRHSLYNNYTSILRGLTKTVPVIYSFLELLFDRYKSTLIITKSVDVELIRHNNNISNRDIISTIGPLESSSFTRNDEDYPRESLVDTTLSLIQMLIIYFKLKTLIQYFSDQTTSIPVSK